MAIYPITRVSVGDSLSVGVPAINNAAQNLVVYSITRPSIPSPVVVPLRNGATNFYTSFYFTVNTAIVNSGALRFIFGGAIVQPNVSVGDQSLYGRAKLTYGAQKTTPLSIGVSSKLPQPLIINGARGLLLIDLTAINAVSNAKNIPFHFGDTLVGSVGLSNTGHYGKAVLTTAFLIRPLGINQGGQGVATTYGSPNKPLDINLVVDKRFFEGRLNFGGPDLVAQSGAIEAGAFGSSVVSKGADQIGPASINSFEAGVPLTYTITDLALGQNHGILNPPFSRNIVTQNSLNVGFYFWDGYRLTTSGRQSSKFGALVISTLQSYITPEGIAAFEYGDALVGNKDISLEPAGIDSTSQPTVPTIINWARNIIAGGIRHGVAGEPSVRHRHRYLVPEALLSLSIGRGLTATHGVREVIGIGKSNNLHGTAWISHSPRFINVSSVIKDTRSNHMVGGTQTLQPTGYIATLFGERIIPVGTNIYPLGLDTEWGMADVGLYTRYVGPRGYNSFGELAGDRWGHNKIYNAVQYINQYYQGDSGLVPPKWSDWQSIENRNKVIGAVGSISQKFGYNQVDNGATILSPSGITPPVSARNDVSLIAYAIRTIALEGIDSFVSESWGVVYNGARVIAPIGDVQTLMGDDAGIVSNRRYYNNVGRIDSLEVGTPAIGYRIRGVDIEPRYSIGPPQIELPTVFLYTRYIDLVGLDSEKHGLPDLSIHFNNIAPSWSHSNRFGYPVLHNVTPTLYGAGHDSSEFGDTSIRTQWRDLLVNGSNTALIGLLKISDTKQAIEVSSLQAGSISQKTIVIKLGTNPYVTQNVWHNNESNNDEGDGYGSNELIFGIVGVNQNVLAPDSIVNPSPFGGISVRTNTISVDGGYFGNSISSKLSIFNKSKFLSVTGIDSAISVGKPRMSPHTIWAVVEAPEQAKRNHDSGGLHYVGETKDKAPGFVVGNPSIESTICTLAPYGFSALRSGDHDTAMSLQIIHPEDFRLSRFGLPSIPFSLQSIGFREGIDASIETGRPSIGPPPYTGPARIFSRGIESPGIGSLNIENKTRYPDISGFDSLNMGLSRPNDTPYMWQGLRVGEFVPMAITGGVITEFGKAWISLRVRDIQAKGTDSFASNYILSSFDDRMKVNYGEYRQPKPGNQEVIADGINSYIGSDANIRLNQHFIRPDGNSDQFRKGGYHA